MNPTLRAALAVVCVCVITVCAILIVGQVAGRARLADLTEQKLYTLSEGTRRILDKLNQPVTLKLYYSRTSAMKGPEQIRHWNNYFLYVVDLLEEIEDRSHGKVALEVIDPRPYTEQEEQAIQYGVRRWQISEDETFFFGLVATTELGQTTVIEFFEPDRQEVAEYDIAKLLSDLMQREKKTIGILADVPILGTDMSPYMMQMLRMQGRRPEPPWTIVEHLRQTYDVQKVDLGETEAAIPEDIDLLMVIHPKELGERTRFAIDQFVMGGGKLIVLTDPHCLADQPQMPMRNRMQAMGQEASSQLNSLLETWGVKMDPDAVVVDRRLGVTTQMDRRRAPVKFPAYLRLAGKFTPGSEPAPASEKEEAPSDTERQGGCFNAEEVVTADLHSLRMLFPGALTRVDGAGTEVRPLLRTTPSGNLWRPSSPFELRFPDPEKILREVPEGAHPLLLACRITGKMKTNFPDGIEIEVEAEEEEGPTPEGEEPTPEPETPAGKAETKEPEAKAEQPETKASKAAPPPAPKKKKEPAKAPPKKAAPKKEAKAAGDKGEPGPKGAKAPEPEPKAKGKAAPAPSEPKAKAPKAKAPEPTAKTKEPPKKAPKAPGKKAPEQKAPEEKAEGKAEEKVPEKTTRRLEAVTEAAEGATVIVVADVDWLTDLLAYQRTFFGMAEVGGNAPFLFNLVDYLVGSRDLIHVRTRGEYDRPFEVFQEIEQRASKATEAEKRALTEKIENYKKELEELGGAATEENIALIQSEALRKRRQLEAEIREANKELRRLEAARREEVEELEASLRRWNLLAAPSLILLIAIVLAVFRWVRAKQYAARRAE